MSRFCVILSLCRILSAVQSYTKYQSVVTILYKKIENKNIKGNKYKENTALLHKNVGFIKSALLLIYYYLFEGCSGDAATTNRSRRSVLALP